MARFQIRNLRWYVAGLICLVTALNYLDRNTLALVKPWLEKEIGLTHESYANVQFAFFIGYMIMYAVSGLVIDYLGTRRGFAVFVSSWALVDLLHSFAQNSMQFLGCRFLLGMTEPANFPAGVKAVSEWFPVRERAFAVGIFNSGTAIGASLAAPLVAWVIAHFGWRYTFVLGAVLSIAWVMVWLLVYRVPQKHPLVTREELALIEEHQPAAAPAERVSIGRILRMKEAWGCILVRAITDPISYFIIVWLPDFLHRERGFDMAALAKLYWIPFVGLALGNLIGGAIPKYLIQHGWTLNRSRKMMMFIAAMMIPASFVSTILVKDPALTIACTATALFFHGSFGNVTLPAEVFPKHVIGSVSGFGGAFGALNGAILTKVVGWMVTVGTYTPVFMLYSILPVAAFAVVCLLIKRLGEIREVPA